MSTATDRRDLVSWIPTAEECNINNRVPYRGAIVEMEWSCAHPALDDGLPLADMTAGDLRACTGRGETPAKAYTQFLDRLTDWQQEKWDARERAEERDGEYAAADAKGDMLRDGD